MSSQSSLPTIPTHHEVAEAMARYGGSFVKGLAIALRDADSLTVRKIQNAWPEYWEQYERMALKMREEDSALDRQLGQQVAAIDLIFAPISKPSTLN